MSTARSIQPPPNLSKSNSPLGKIIAYFKYHSTKHINQLRNTPGTKLWQRNYYEHIIRDEYGLHRIQKYIIDNPLDWKADKKNSYEISGA